MELPIIAKFEQMFYDTPVHMQEQKIRILDIDGTFLVSLFTFESFTSKFVSVEETAFSTYWEAQDFLRCIGVDLEEEKDIDWRGYDYD